MITLQQIAAEIEKYAPINYQEPYDNSGLIYGDLNRKIDKALICVDVTESVVDESIEMGCNLIISHHPLIFGGLKNVNTTSFAGGILEKAIQKGIYLYTAHTNLDNAYMGVSGIFAKKLGLKDIKVLSPTRNVLFKLVVFCPSGHADSLRKALFEAGAGEIGNYDSCSYSIKGRGSFRAGEDSNPFVGEKGTLHFEEEERIETIFPVHLKNRIIKSLLNNHPYEEVAYDIYPLDNVYDKIGSGVIGRLEAEMRDVEFLDLLKKISGIPTLRHTRLFNRKLNKIALCGGSGSFLINNAKAAGADVFVTGDLKYHQFFESDDKLCIVDTGHYESEQFVKELIYTIVNEKFPNFALHISNINTNPVHYY